MNIDITNQAPLANGTNYFVQGNQALTVSAAKGVLADAYDPDGDSVSAQLVQWPQNGTLTLNADGGFTYTPNPNFLGQDGFWIRPMDGNVLGFGLPAFIGLQIGNLLFAAQPGDPNAISPKASSR